jgi:alkanesulfonate monooxygenase SsuD/methylene tetrahydromethanopterin reductase-like flavin-dependent oxidoreductase (luciferase family)
MTMVGAFGLSNSHLLWTREAYPTRAYQSLGNLAPSGGGPDRSGPGDPHGIPEGICVGDPDRIADAIARWESIGVTGINFLLNAIECVPQEKVLDSLRLFATEVLPRFGDRTSC